MKALANPIVKVDKLDPHADKKALRLKQLQESYDIIRSKPITCATVVKLNYVEPAPPVVEERPLSVDPKAAVVKGAPAKKK